MWRSGAGFVTIAALMALPADGVALGRAGDADPTFHGGTPATADLSKSIPRSSHFRGAVIDGAGRILATGSATDADGRTAAGMARFRADGTLDPAFGTGGSRVVQLGTGANPFTFAHAPFGVPGRYAGFGIYRTVEGRGDHSALLIREDGSSDLDIGSGGLITRDPATAPAYASTAAATVGTDGNVFVTGTLESTPATGANRRLVLTRFTPQGTPAPGFGSGGTVTFTKSESPSDTGTYGGALLALPNDRLLVGGIALLPTGRHGMLLMRLSQLNGTADEDFGTKPGSTLLNASDPAAKSADSQVITLARRADGAIYVGGNADDADGDSAATVVRLTAAGRPDFTFANNGVKRVQLGEGSARSSVQAIVLQGDGKVVAVAAVHPASGGVGRTHLFRLDNDGALDPTFGTNGVATIPMSGSGATIQDGRLLVVGSVSDGPRADAAIGRFLLAPLPDPPPAPPATPAGPAPAGEPPATGPIPAPPAVGPAAAPIAPAGALRVTAKTLSVDARGRLNVPVTCSAAGRCAGRIGIVAMSGRAVLAQSRRATVYARTSYELAPRATRRVVLRLGPTMRRRARRGTGVAARLVVAPSGKKATVTRVRLRRPR